MKENLVSQTTAQFYPDTGNFNRYIIFRLVTVTSSEKCVCSIVFKLNLALNFVFFFTVLS